MNFATRLRRKRLGRPGLRAESGAAALEFALVGPLFVFLACVAFDLGLLLFTQSVMNNAARDAARIIRTNATGGNASSFSTKLCNEMSGLVQCSKLQYYVQSAATFSTMSASITTDANGNLKNAGTFSPGARGQDVVVQVGYLRPTLIPWVVHYLNGTNSTVSKSNNLLVTTIIFQNEP